MTARVWVPTGLGRRKDLAALAYVVVEEIESDFVGLTVSPWPTLDDRGRLRFDLEPSREIGARRRELQAFLGKNRTPKKLARRPLRIGDVFACAIRGPLQDGALLAPEAWMVGPVTDVSAHAREAAKIAFFSAAAPLARPEADQEIVTLAPQSAPLKSTRSPTGPDPFGTARD
jgi:hypothetical protein